MLPKYKYGKTIKISLHLCSHLLFENHFKSQERIMKGFKNLVLRISKIFDFVTFDILIDLKNW